jgi:sugar phosphate isomerase/epimerase
MRTIKGPAVFLAQFAADEAPFNTLKALAGWAADKGFKGVQIPTWDTRVIDLELAAESQDYVDEFKGTLAEHGLEVTDLASHLQGQLVALHPSFNLPADSFAPKKVHRNAKARQEWAVNQLLCAAKASRRFGIDRHTTFSGTLLWPYFYPYPQWPDGLISDGFDELARRWRPILDAFDREGVDVCYEIHPTEDLHDGLTFEMFLERVDNHPRCNIMYDPSHLVLQSIDYLTYIDHYHQRIKTFHVKDAEFRPTGKTGAYGGYQPWISRAGRFPFAGRWSGRFRRDLFEAFWLRFRRLGGSRMGVRNQEFGRRSRRRRSVHQRPHHPRLGTRLRRLRQVGRGPCGKQ